MLAFATSKSGLANTTVNERTEMVVSAFSKIEGYVKLVECVNGQVTFMHGFTCLCGVIRACLRFTFRGGSTEKVDYYYP